MWFKNIQTYQFTKQFNYNSERIENELNQLRFKPCAKILPMSTGWTAPIGQGEAAPLVHSSNGLLLICLKIEEKILPATVIREQVKERILVLEDEQQRKLSSKEKMSLKDEIYSQLLPQAFSKNNKIYAYINPKTQQLLIDTPSRAKAEDFITFLRKSLGSLPISFPDTVLPSKLMSKWLKSQKTPSGFELGESCTLYDSKVEGGSVRCSKQDLLSDNIQAFVNDGMEVIQLQLYWKEHLSFNLREDFSITQLKFTDAVQNLADDIHTENPEQQFDADFFIMSQTINEFLEALLHVFRKN